MTFTALEVPLHRGSLATRPSHCPSTRVAWPCAHMSPCRVPSAARGGGHRVGRRGGRQDLPLQTSAPGFICELTHKLLMTRQ